MVASNLNKLKMSARLMRNKAILIKALLREQNIELFRFFYYTIFTGTVLYYANCTKEQVYFCKVNLFLLNYILFILYKLKEGLLQWLFLLLYISA